mgnify:CR=1 FL=1
MADTATTGVAAAAQTNEPLIRVEGLRKSCLLYTSDAADE